MSKLSELYPLPFCTVAELKAMTPRELLDLPELTLIVSEPGAFGVPLAVMVPFAMYQRITQFIAEAERDTEALARRFTEVRNGRF